jgi:RNA polymerase sigma-70 factor, ECF subfamily
MTSTPDPAAEASRPLGWVSAESRASSRDVQATRLGHLLAQAARGQEDSFAELYDLTNARVYGVILRVLRSRDLATEVTQDVYLEIWRQAGRYAAERGSPMAWMTTMAHRRAVDRVRSVQSDTARENRFAVVNAERDVDRVWEELEQRLDTERVQKALGSLTEIQREALTLAYFGGYTQSQVAALLNLPLGTVKTRIRDGLIGLRDALGVGA